MQDLLKHKQKLRLLVLHKMYELSGSDVHKFVNGGDLYQACGDADEASFKSAVDYLERIPSGGKASEYGPARHDQDKTCRNC